MIEIQIADLFNADSFKEKVALLPDTARQFLTGLEEELNATYPKKKPTNMGTEGEEAFALAVAVGETPDPERPKPVVISTVEPGTFERTRLAVFADWCKENDERTLERVCRFLVAFPGYKIMRNESYWRLVPEGEKKANLYVSDYSSTLIDLLCTIGAAINERLAMIGQ